MSAAEVEWEPGDPLMPDNGCGGGTTIWMSQEERAATIAADTGTPPPWWRPDDEYALLNAGYTRSCATCGVRWRGDEPCWMCGGEQLR